MRESKQFPAGIRLEENNLPRTSVKGHLYPLLASVDSFSREKIA